MPVYDIEQYEVHAQTYRVEAESAAHAIKKVFTALVRYIAEHIAPRWAWVDHFERNNRSGAARAGAAVRTEAANSSKAVLTKAMPTTSRWRRNAWSVIGVGWKATRSVGWRKSTKPIHNQTVEDNHA